MRSLPLFLAAVLWAGAAGLNGAAAQSASAPDAASSSWSNANAPRFVVAVHAGATTFGLSQASEIYRRTVTTYQWQGVDIPIQKVYPATSLWGAEALVRFSRIGPTTLSAGIGAQYGRTEAASLYGDVNGTLDVTSTARMWTLEAISRVDVETGTRFRVYGGIRGGLLDGSVSFEEKVVMDVPQFNLPAAAASARVDASGRSFTTGAFGGVRADAGPVRIVLQAGARYGVVSRPDATGSTTDGREVSGPLVLNVEFNGLTGTLGIELPL